MQLRQAERSTILAAWLLPTGFSAALSCICWLCVRGIDTRCFTDIAATARCDQAVFRHTHHVCAAAEVRVLGFTVKLHSWSMLMSLTQVLEGVALMALRVAMHQLVWCIPAFIQVVWLLCAVFTLKSLVLFVS